MYELCFTRYDGDLYYALAKRDSGPIGRPRKVKSVREAYHILSHNQPKIEIYEVGICPPDMLGLE